MCENILVEQINRIYVKGDIIKRMKENYNIFFNTLIYQTKDDWNHAKRWTGSEIR